MEYVQIRQISETYFESFHQCLDSVAREKKYLAITRAPPFEKLREFLRSDVKLGVIRLVAVKQGNVIGWCDIAQRGEGFNHSGRLAMGVALKHRGKGIGKVLLKNGLNEAKKKGIERIELEVYASNLTALNLYKSYGFVIEGIKTKARKLEGVYDNIIEMALIFDP